VSPSILLLAIALVAIPTLCVGQPARDSLAPNAKALWTGDRYVDRRASLEFELNRPLLPGERIGLVLANTDVSMAVEVRDEFVRYRPVGWPLPSGESEAVVYLIDRGGEWKEIGRSALRVLTRLGLERAHIVPMVDVSSTGPLDRRAMKHDVTLRVGLENAFASRGWEITAQGNAVGVTEPTQRLRWEEQRSSAPSVDLSDYRLSVSRGETRLALGGVSAGSHRHLLDDFASRGLSAAVRLGRAGLDAAVINGSSIVGWNNLGGLAEPDHRIAFGSFGVELSPARPGALRIDISSLDGSILPRNGYNEDAVTDAESSRGWGVQLSASDARQRVRLTGGIARSRFVNPVDHALNGDTLVQAVRPTTRSARYGELSLQLLQGLRLGEGTETTLSATLRHERVDPLFRSVGAGVQSDVQNDGLELAGSIGALSFAGGATVARDNLGRIASILTTRTHGRRAGIAAPLAQMFAAPNAWYLPSLGYTWQRTGQHGDGVPLNGDFSASHVPDQLNIAQTGTATWSRPAWSLTYQVNGSYQDNRQVGRERADFRGVGHAVSLQFTRLRVLSPSLDASLETQRSIELGLTQRTRRVALSVLSEWSTKTSLTGSVSHARAFDPFEDRRSLDTELHVELAQGFDLYRRLDSGTQARVFVRYARTGMERVPRTLPEGAMFLATWTLDAGASIRLY
jgi:hypothetical protein